MKVEAREIVAALEAAIDDQRQHVAELEEDHEAGYVDGLVRALDIVTLKCYGLKTGSGRHS